MGHSALVYLKKLPVTQIKIDRSFVNDVLTDSNDAAIIQMILAIGKTIQCNIVAEGVEQLEQFKILKKFGCHFFQGFYFSQPLELEEFESLVQANPDVVKD
jgi:EAL domain-containing protein (putative c-di-GMP-specific phosphodiesterase class I)